MNSPIVNSRTVVMISSLSLLLAACGDSAKLPVKAPASAPTRSCRRRTTSLIPTVNIATAIGWPAGAKPDARGRAWR